METIINIPTTFTCQYFQDKKTLIIRSTSKYIKEYLETIQVEYSNILDGYVIETSKTIIDIVGLHKFIIEKLNHNLEETLKEKEDSNSSSYITVETIEEELTVEPEGYLVCIKNDHENDLYEWVIYFDESVDEEKALKKQVFKLKKKEIRYDEYYGGHLFKCKKNDKFVKKLEENNFIKVNGVFKKLDKKLCLYLSMHLTSEERDKEIEKIKKAKGKFNFVNNGFLFSLKKENELIKLGYIFVS